MKFFIILMISLFFIACSADKNHHGFKKTPESSERKRLCNIIRSKVAAKLKREKGLLPFGFGGQTSHGVEMLALSFNYREPATIEVGRQLLITAVNEFITAINAEKRIQKYLNNHPFGAKNIEIRIFLENANSYKDKLGLRVISACEGILRYKIDDPNGPLFKILLTETYEEALLKVESITSLDNPLSEETM